ncbi:1-deoxy-D-xylulose-5-phosphate reductoisomerase, partial [Microgenomates group bacterium]|nr:1-deoxy-D-xylulose-5-phosphate reductoisomerase [Microgenomates group bacterium]
MKKIVILGSTGHIGQSALRIAERFPSELKIIGLSCYHDSELFQAQVSQFKPSATCIANTDPSGLERLASLPEADLVIVSVVGVAGIAPTLAAIAAGTNVALATKEVLVIAGHHVLSQAKKNHVAIIPIDSEHSALFQSLQAAPHTAIDKIYLTMGTGKIAQMSPAAMARLQPQEVL